MKNKAFIDRIQFAWNGFRTTLRTESSFRLQCLAAILAFGVLIIFKAEPVWWALFSLVIGSILACELLNTALEHLMDHLHPERHDAIGIAKDCAAAAVLMLSLAAVIIFICFIVQHFSLFSAICR